jgi:hypothetical protein
MKRMKRDAIVALVIEKLREHGSWGGETHVQKAVYLLQEMLSLDTGFDFIFYKHGPFSFDLRDELTAMRADEFLDLELRSPSYGPSLALGRNARFLKHLFPKTLEKREPKVEFLASRFGKRNVTELERIATAFYVTKEAKQPLSDDERAVLVTQLKPHIPLEEAISAVKTVDDWSREIENQFHTETAGA